MKHIYIPYQIDNPTGYGKCYVRWSLNGSHGLVVRTNDFNQKWTAPHAPLYEFDTMQEAMTVLDEYLLSRGHTLLTEEQYDKIKALI